MCKAHLEELLLFEVDSRSRELVGKPSLMEGHLNLAEVAT